MARKRLTNTEKADIVAKTNSHCHICGEWIDTSTSDGSVFDHIVPADLDGPDEPGNLLLACRSCNGLRWHHRPETIRRILFLGVIANQKGYKQPSLSSESKAIRLMRARRLVENWQRRSHLRSHLEAEKLLRRFNRFENRVVQQVQISKDRKHRWSEMVERALLDRSIAIKDRSAYKRVLNYEKPGPEERKEAPEG